MAEPNEIEEENEGGQGEVEPPEEDVPVYRKEKKPSGKVDQIMWWAFRGKTRKELEKPPYNYKGGSIRSAFGRLADQEPDWVETKEGEELSDKPVDEKNIPATARKSALAPAKGSAPEVIIENITIPMIDGQSQGFEQGMKFGMLQLVLAVRVMQELSAIGLQQVKPLIDMTKSVREGETAAFKSGADEAAMKSAQAMGSTILPMISELQTTITNAGKANEADPMKGMMVRTMEPLINNIMKRMLPGTETPLPDGWSRKKG